jgi:thiol-disulfide isomerase/thioredoxin
VVKCIGNKVVLFFLLILCIQSCENERIEGPAIRFESDTCYFGEIKNGEVIYLTASFFNPGSDTLVLESVRSSCSSCTKIDGYDERVAPGGSGKILITYKAKTDRFPLYANIMVYVKTNISDKPDITLIVTGNVVETPAEVQVIPRALMFGEIDRKDTLLTGTVRLRSYFDGPLIISDIIPPNEKTKIKVNMLEENKDYIINVAVHSPFKKGDRGEEMILKTNLKEKPVIIVPYVYSFNPPKGFKQIIKDKFSKILLMSSFFGRKNDVERRLHQLERLEEIATKIPEPSRCGKGGDEYVAMLDKFYELRDKRANMAMKFLTEFSPADLNEDDLISFLGIAKVAKDEQQVFNISKILFEKFPESRSDLNLMKAFFMNSCLLEPGEVVKYINIDMFKPEDQLGMYYMLALSFSEWGNTEETMNYTGKAENLYQLINSDYSKRALIPILDISTARAFVLEKVGYNERAYEVINEARSNFSDSSLIQKLGSIERRLNVLGKEALPLRAQHWSGIEKPLELLDLKGKVVLIVFSAWDCKQCNIDLPYLFRLQEEVNNDDFIIIGAIKYVSTIYELGGLNIFTWQEYEQMIDDYRKARKINWPISMSKESFYDYGVINTPDFILIDKEGVVRDGYFIYNYSYLKKKIIKLLEES